MCSRNSVPEHHGWNCMKVDKVKERREMADHRGQVLACTQWKVVVIEQFRAEKQRALTYLLKELSSAMVRIDYKENRQKQRDLFQE